MDPTNYTPTSARQLLGAPFAEFAPTAATPNSSGSVVAGNTAGGGASLPQKAAGQTSLSDAQRASYLNAIQRCEAQTLPANASNLTPLRYIVGTFEKTPVFFLMYSVTSGGETKLELWVVQRNDCYIRFFVPPR